MTEKQNKIYQEKLTQANELLYKAVEDMQQDGRSLREIARLLCVKRADVITILKKDVGVLSYSAVLRIQSSLLTKE